MPSMAHTHKYQLVILGGRRVVKREGKKYIEKCGGYEVFRCMITGCTHWIARELATGRKSLCWVCGEELILNKENTNLKFPTHVYCRKIRERIS